MINNLVNKLRELTGIDWLVTFASLALLANAGYAYCYGCVYLKGGVYVCKSDSPDWFIFFLLVHVGLAGAGFVGIYASKKIKHSP